jgi:energy-coupling factor transport system ATP-binding protein
VNISYKINGKHLLYSVDLPIKPGKAILVTGVENNNLNLLGGIIGKLFPIEAKIDIPEINALISNFNGDLEIKDGVLPESVAYLSADPDRHLLFATVKEELLLAQPNMTDFGKILETFGLDQSFYGRKIASLSGGEKMKVALALTFAKHVDCYVLHGVIPWLDQTGRDLLIQSIKQRKNNDACIVFIEHEINQLVDVVDNVFWFDGQTITQPSNESFFAADEKPEPLQAKYSEKLLEFADVALAKHPFYDEIRAKPILDDISFVLNADNVYALAGDNGAGKSTIAQMLFRIIKPTSGEIKFLDQPLSNYSRAELNELICYIGQFPAQQITLSTVGQYQIKLKKNTLAQEIFEKHLNLLSKAPIATLTFLQMKLLVLANCIDSKTKLIILDEPSWGLDKEGQQLFWQILQELRQKLGATLFLISHDIDLIHRFTVQVMCLTKGKITLEYKF